MEYTVDVSSLVLLLASLAGGTKGGGWKEIAHTLDRATVVCSVVRYGGSGCEYACMRVRLYAKRTRGWRAECNEARERAMEK